MHYMFVDESGHPLMHRVHHGDDDIYILCGLIVDADDVHRARAAVDGAKRELFKGKDPLKWELHGYEIWRGIGRFADDLRITTNEQKFNVFTRTVKAIEESEAVLVTVIMSKNRIPYGRHNLFSLSWKLLTERFEHYLARRGGGDRGEIVADTSSRGTEAKIRSLLQGMSVGMGRHQHNPSLVSTDVRFVNSASDSLVQAVDMAAYIIHKYYRGDVLFKGLFDDLVPCMWHHDGILEGYGIKHYPDRG